MISRRTLRRVAIVLLGLVLVLTTAHIIWTYVEKSGFQARMERVRQAGDPIYLTDLAMRPVPDERNAAKLLEEAAAWLEARRDRDDEYGDALLFQSKRAREEDWTEDEWNHLYRYLDSLKPYYAMIEQVPQRPEWSVDIAPDDPISSAFRPFPWAQEVVEYTLYRVQFDRVEKGRTERAARAAVFLLDFADRCKLPLFYGHLVSHTNTNQTGVILRIASERPGFDARLFRQIVEPRLAAAIAPTGPPVEVVHALRAEALRWMRAWLAGETADVSPSDHVWRNVFWRPLLYRDGSRMLDLHARVIPSCGVSPEEAWPIGERLRNEYGGGVKLYPVLTRTHGATCGGAFRQFTISTATRRLTCVVMAILEYKQTAGVWPASLDVLGDLPLDPFTARPLVYERRADGARIHVSWPGKDWETLVVDDLAWSFQE